MQAHSKIKVVLKNEEIILIFAPSGLSMVAPYNDFWNVYDLDGKVHVFNWDCIAHLTIEQVSASAEEPPAVPPL
jgi:hypothetical protein